MESFILTLSTQIPGFLLAIVAHEAAHAYVAHKYGDDTAKDLGRLSLNPLVHLDILGTVILPIALALLGGTMFGWAKPVPVDYRRFKNFRKGIFWVSFAGPLANILLAIISAFFLVLMTTKVSPTFYFFTPFVGFMRQAMIINIVLAVFNLIPFPPLDGSKMVSSFLSYDAMIKYESLQRFTFLFIALLWMTNIFQYLLYPALIFGNGLIMLFYHILA